MWIPDVHSTAPSCRRWHMAIFTIGHLESRAPLRIDSHMALRQCVQLGDSHNALKTHNEPTWKLAPEFWPTRAMSIYWVPTVHGVLRGAGDQWKQDRQGPLWRKCHLWSPKQLDDPLGKIRQITHLHSNQTHSLYCGFYKLTCYLPDVHS